MRHGWLLGVLIAGAASLLATAPSRADRAVVFAGGGQGGDGGPAAEAKLHAPFGVAVDGDGNTYVVEYAGHRVRRIDPEGTISTVAGTGEKGGGGDGGPAVRAQLNAPHAIVLGPDGHLYIADTNNYRVRRVDLKAGTISTFAGTGKKGYAGDGGPAADAQFSGIYSVAFDPKGDRLFLADLDNRRVRAVEMKTGVVTTVAGNGQKGVPADGAEAAKSPLVDPRAAAADAAGNVYVLERSGHALRVVDRAGAIRTVAGTGKQGAAGDGGPARDATMNGPKHLCVDGEGNVILADTENHVIRKYLPTDGKIVRVAGTGKRGNAGAGGPPDRVELNKPHGVYLHAGGALFISDSENGRVLRIDK